MVKSIFRMAVLFFCTFLLLHAQNFFGQNNDLKELYWKEMIEEKIRNKSLRQHFEKAAELQFSFHKNEMSKEDFEKKKAQMQQDFEGIKKDYHKSIEQSTQAKSDFIIDPEGAEPHIVINPNDPQHLVVSYMEAQSQDAPPSYPIFYSLDGGESWEKSSFNTLAEFSNLTTETLLGGGDPILAFGLDGRLHLTYLYATSGDGFDISMYMLYVYSDDGGKNFVVPDDDIHIVGKGGQFGGNAMDREWMAVDESDGPYSGNLYFTSVSFNTATSGQILLRKKPEEDKLNFVKVIVPAGNGVTQFANIKVGDDGVVHKSCLKIDFSGSGKVIHASSEDGGDSWELHEIANCTSLNPQEAHIVHARNNPAPSLAADGKTVYLTWVDQANNDNVGYYAYSNDNGANWSAPIVYNKEVFPDNDAYQVMGTIAADDGVAVLTWQEVDKSTMKSETWTIDITDDGKTFGTPVKVSPGETDFTGMGGNTSVFFGDYNAAQKVGCDTYHVWSDGSGGMPQIYVSKTEYCGEGIVDVTEVLPVNAGLFATCTPNPITGTGQIQLKSDKENRVSIQLFDLKGRLMTNVYSGKIAKGNTSFDLNTASLYKGVYLLKVSTHDHINIVRKVMVF